MGKAESPIQSYVSQRLELLERTHPVYFFRANSFSGKITRWDGSQGYIKNNKKGLPDIVALICGAFVGFELKSATGKQTTEQKLAQQSIEGCGGKYYIIKTPEEFEEILKQLL